MLEIEKRKMLSHSQPAGCSLSMKLFPFLLFVLFVLHASVAHAKVQPNIIFILTDDQGYGDLGRHGHPLLKTPQLDRLHDESVRFDNFYVSPSCSPTRAALMTGMHEFRNGVTHTRAPREHLRNNATLLPQILKTAGYTTAHIGKWHLGWNDEYHPHRRGFDWTLQGAKHFDPKLTIYKNGQRPTHTQGKGFREDLYFDHAMSFIKQAGSQPFFLYLATYSPHTPLLAPEKYIEPYRGKCTDEEATYLGMIENIDFNVGRLLSFLKKQEIDQDTIIIFMNDNGVTVGLDIYNADMRGSKCTIWEGGSRAMSFWRWPGTWKPKTVTTLTAHLDVLPTLCELAGAEIPTKLQSQLEGFSLNPLLSSEKPIVGHNDRLLYQHVGRWPSGMAAQHKHAMAGVRQGNYLLVRSRPCDDPDCTVDVLGMQCHTLRSIEEGSTHANYTKNNGQFHWGVSPRGKWVLYDTKKDPGCQNDLSSEQPERVEAMAESYDRWWDDVYPTMVEHGGENQLTEILKKKRNISP